MRQMMPITLTVFSGAVRMPDGTSLDDMDPTEVGSLPKFIPEESQEGLTSPTPFFEGWLCMPGDDEPSFWWRLHYLPRTAELADHEYGDPQPWVLTGSRP